MKAAAPLAAAQPHDSGNPQAPLAVKLAALGRTPWSFALASLILLAPCYWHRYIEAGDLSSHIYNSWLAQLIETHGLQGLVVARQVTNVLFDLLLSGLFRAFGPDAAQRMAAGLAVLTFVWGAFAFMSVACGRRAWAALPAVAMLAYGFVFHMGFFDFYLAAGLCLCGLALVWKPTLRRAAVAAVLFILALAAHALAFAWGIGLAAFVLAARRLTAPRRWQLLGAGVGAMLIGHIAVGNSLVMRWSSDQFTLLSGADQLRVFDDKYSLLFVALLIVWVLWLVRLMKSEGAGQIGASLPLQLFILSAAAVFLLPAGVLIPGYRHALAYIPERMSLCAGVCLCALLAKVRPGTLERYALAAITLLFFVFLYRDEGILSALEQRMHNLVLRLPAGQRVLSGIDDPSLRINALTHMIDRACIGHCYSYANYEPSTWQFRVRAVAPNPYVASEYQDSFALQTGRYVIKQQDVPIFTITTDPSGNMVIVTLPPGAPNGMKFWKILPDLF